MCKQYLVSLGGLVYLPNMPDFLMMSVPDEGSRFEITDIPFVTGKEYDQWKFVNRRTAETLVERYPDMWKIVREDDCK